jgi:aspartyl-tRNA(Asn)/glutamyl-tRNA(Gln) amidotransferase subunit A
MRRAAAAALESCDVLATPSVAAMRKVIGVDTIEIDGEVVDYRAALSCFSALANQMGVPALSVPLNIAGTPPPSVQLVGPMWSEHRLLSLGKGLEAAGVVGVASAPSLFMS